MSNINGFLNLGNTCYLNSTLQLLFSIQELKKYFINKNFLEELNNNLKKKKILKKMIMLNIIFYLFKTTFL